MPDRLTAILQRIAGFVDRSIVPLEADLTTGPFGRLVPRLAALREQVKAPGLWAPHLPTRHGGFGLTLTEFAPVSAFDNLVLDPFDLPSIRAVLEWEMATIGDPLMDLGTTLGYWVDPDDPEPWQHHRFGLTTLPGTLSRRGIVDRYVAASGRPVGDPLVYYVFGLFKIAAIAQQIYKRHTLGLTRDSRFGGLAGVVRSCGLMASLAIDRGRIDRLG